MYALPSIFSPSLSAAPGMSRVSPLDAVEAAKRLAAYTAVDRHIRPEDKVIGIGSGSTVPYVVERILQQGEERNRDRVFLPTGFQSQQLITHSGLRLGDIMQYSQLDVTIDGADEVDADLNCIKGGGACQLREKVLAEVARTFIVVADYRKNSAVLGTSVSFPVPTLTHNSPTPPKYTSGVPIEVSPFAHTSVLRSLHTMLDSPKATLRMARAKAGPVVTDNGNFIIDAPFTEAALRKPHELLVKIKLLTGVVEVGLFCDIVKAAYFGNQDGSVSARFENGETAHIESSN
ncbi:ribose-5-phosphate isomerase [Russula ochroleuca]|uniref:Ribose-5-phosphate isomerase n=1 Tax=Russula ochroleuca TaxID=152965 RepID=A0A9P5N184_9AGAM|nr:ribose-5-phosphate isomerase [Russula ochroleuca]